MVRPTNAPGAEADEPIEGVDPEAADDVGPAPLDGLTVAGITRRRVLWLIGGFMSLWILIVFARQVGEASAATTKADELGAANQRLAADVDALARELELVQRQEFIVQQARGEGLGRGREIPFKLAADAPPLDERSAGSAPIRSGDRAALRTPLESWLSILFGPTG